MNNALNLPIFIVGTGRSGSTIMKRSLGEHSSTQTFDYELQLWTDPAVKQGIWTLLVETKWGPEEKSQLIKQYLLSRYSISSKGRNFSMNWIGAAYYEASIQKMLNSVEEDKKSTITAIRNFFYEVYSNSNAHLRVVDDAPINGLIIPQIQQVYPEAKFIHMIRNGVSVSSSMLKLGWETSFETCAQRWASALMRTRNIGATFGVRNYMEVRLEELSRNPEPVMREVCDFLSLQYDHSMIKHLDIKKAGHEKYGEIQDHKTHYVNSLYKI